MCKVALMFAVFAVSGWCRWCTAADEQRSSNVPETPTIVSSEKVVLNDTLFRLEAEGSRFFLVSRPLEGTDRQAKREPLEASASTDGRPEEICLAAMGEKNLLAVVKVCRPGKYDFHCLTFIGPWSNQPQDTPFKTHEAKFYSTSQNQQILAISGKHAMGSALIVLGDIPRPGQPSKGMIYFSGCPWPPSDGLLLKYEARASEGD